MFVRDRVPVSVRLIDWPSPRVVPVWPTEGLLEVSGIRSSLLRSSFFSKEAKAGSASVFPPLAKGTVGCNAPEDVISVGCVFWRL